MMNKSWSSFDDDKRIMDSWKHYLNEDESATASSEEPLDSESEETKTTLMIKLKNVFGATMDIAGLASFFPGVGQGIGAAATAASLLNYLTYPLPKYAWAAVDAAALTIALIPGGTGIVKAGSLAAKVTKAVRLGKDVAKVATAAKGAQTIKQEFENDLGPELAAAVEKALTKTAEDGKYYADVAIDKILDMTDKSSEGHKRLLELKRKIKQLQKIKTQPPVLPRSRRSGRRAAATAVTPTERRPWVIRPEPPRRAAAREEILRESEIKRWQQLARIM